MMFVVRPLPEMGQRQGIPLYTCFVDLTREHDSHDGTILRAVLQRSGVPSSRLSVIRQYGEGMRGCVRTADGVCLEWFSVEQGLCQGFVLEPWLFNIFFIAVLDGTLVYFRIDPDIAEGMVNIWGGEVGGQDRKQE